MPSGGEVILGGVPYPLVASEPYRRRAQAVGAPRSGRVEVVGPFNGQRQAIGLPGGSWDATGTGPTLDRQGVEPWPAKAIHVDSMTDVPTIAQRAYATVAANAVYIGIGRRLYRTVPLTTGSWSSLAVAADFGAGQNISSLTTLGDEVIVGLGPGTDGRRYSPAAAGHSVWRVGARLAVCMAYAGQLLYASRTGATAAVKGEQERLRLSLTRHDGTVLLESRWLDAPIINMGLFMGRVAIATKASMWLMGGRPYEGVPDDATTAADEYRQAEWIGEPEPVFTHGLWTAEEDFIFMLGFAGRLWTWVGGSVRSWSGSVGDGWVDEGLSGGACYGACVAAGWLIVAIKRRTDESELWATDGTGWWRIQMLTTTSSVWPVSLQGAGNMDVLAFRSGLTTYDLARLFWRSASLHALGASGDWLSSLLDAGTPSEVKGWTRIGARFASPDTRGLSSSTASLTVALQYSVDGGVSWVTAVTKTLTGASTRIADLTADLSAVEGAYIQLRVSWSSVLDWAPTLVAAWADWTLARPVPGKRTWEFTVAALDGRVAPDGAAVSRTGRQLAAALWAAHAGGVPVTFRDVDYDAVAVERRVAVREIEERTAKPADQGRWGATVIRLALDEV